VGVLIVTIHLLSSSVVHCLLLFRKLPEPFPNSIAFRYRALCLFARACVYLKKGGDFFTDAASTVGLRLTGFGVLEKPFHFGTVVRRAAGIFAAAGVH